MTSVVSSCDGVTGIDMWTELATGFIAGVGSWVSASVVSICFRLGWGLSVGKVRKHIDRDKRVRRSHLLQDRPNKENNRTPLLITLSPQLKPLQCIMDNPQPILENDHSLSQTLGDSPVLTYRQPP